MVLVIRKLGMMDVDDNGQEIEGFLITKCL
jgi:hypothetical protein